MFCRGGQTKILDFFAHLQNKMHCLNDVQDLVGGGGKQMFVEILVMECKGEALEF